MKTTIKNLLRPYKARLLSITTLLFVFAKICSKIFFKPKFPDTAKVGLNLHLGSGNVYHPNFINIDGFPYPNVHYVRNIYNLKNFEDNTVDSIYASHCLEHFEYSKINSVLSEWFRVLRPGGVLRLSVPDFDKLLYIYNQNGRDPETIIPQLLGGQDHKFNYHYVIFNESNLSQKLLACGFSKTKIWNPGESVNETFSDFSIYKKEINGIFYEVSLNLEAYK